MKNNRLKFIQIKLALVFGLLLAIYAMFSSVYPNSLLTRQCKKLADPIEVIIGDNHFQIPAIYDPILHGKDAPEPEFVAAGDRENPKQMKRGFCHSEEAPFILSDWGIYGSGFKDGFETLATFPLLSKISILSVHAGSADPIVLFCKKKKEIEKEIDGWQAYNRNADFVLGARNASSYQYYLSKENLLFGMPALIPCTPEIGDSIFRFSCDFNFKLTAEAYVRIQFSGIDIPPENWSQLLAEINQFFNQIMPKPPSGRSFTSCTDG